MRGWAALLAAPAVVVFAGPRQSVAAPDGSGARLFYRYRMDRDGSQAHPVFYDDGRGHRSRVGTVTRSMGVSWSPDGRRAFLQDNWGSDVASCYVLDRVGSGVRRTNLFALVQRTPGHPTGTERPFRSHYYVHCDAWRSANRIAGAVSGHTDTNPSHGFDHHFTYDARTRRLRWRR